MGLGAPELLIILAIILLAFGTSRLPKLARSMGEAQKEFKKGLSEKEKEEQEQRAAAAAAAAVPPVTPAPDDKVTLSRAELEALLAEREARAKEPPPPA